jgi:CheY-like chemotaxis protein
MATKILVVEDNESIRTIVRTALEMDEYEVIEADNGMKGLQILKRNPDCALVITDLAMPVMDGYELLARIRGDMRLRSLPVFVLTAEKDATAALDKGATRLIRKPFSPIELLESVRRALRPPTP